MRGHAGNALEVNIAAKTAVRALVHADVDHDRAGLDPIRRHELGLSHGNKEQIGLAREAAQVSRVAVWQTVTVASPPGPFLKQQKRQRPAHDARAAQDDGVGSAGLDLRVEQELSNSQRRAGNESRRSRGQQPEVGGMKTVDVLLAARLASTTIDSSICRGSGSCTRMPWTAESAFEPIDRREQLGLRGAQPASRRTWPFIPAALHAAALFRT